MKHLCILFLLFSSASAQFGSPAMGKEFMITSAHSMFPDSLRNVQPRVYNGKTYTAAEHYSDSSAYIFVPSNFNPRRPFHFIFWFHGWGNNIDSALARAHLRDQFYAAQQNAILVLPEAAKDAPDSYAGKFEQAGVFNGFMNDLLSFLTTQRVVPADAIFDIVLAGHSGAYRAMANVFQFSSYPVTTLLLFDALYGEQDKFMNGLQKNTRCKMINIYTDSGGTFENSKKMVADMQLRKWSVIDKEEDDCSYQDLKMNRIVFLHSRQSHNGVVTHQNNFDRFLQVLE